MAVDFTFDKDLSSAQTIPSSWYRDPAVLQREQDRIFAKTWQLVGHSEQVALPGDYFTCVVADEPLVVTRADAVLYCRWASEAGYAPPPGARTVKPCFSKIGFAAGEARKSSSRAALGFLLSAVRAAG